MAINPAFLGHGIFTEFSVTNALKRYTQYAPPGTVVPAGTDAIDRFILALKHMEISSVWIHLFSRGVDCEDATEGSHDQRKALFKRLRAANIACAAWGYCAGHTHVADLKMIKTLQADSDLAPTAFIIDAEPGNDIRDPANPGHKMKDRWVLTDFDQFVGSVNQLLGTDNLAVSTWPVLQFHDDFDATKLMQKAAGRVCLFAPQVYWMNHPSHSHARDFDPAVFTPHDAEAYVRLVMEAWRRTGIANPLVISGQSYWEVDGGDGTPPRNVMEAKTQRVVSAFTGWNKILGFNWYHAGLPTMTADKGSMSDAMINSIAAAKLGDKPYKPA